MRPAHQTEGFRKSCLQGTLVGLAIGRPCAKTPKARMRSVGSKVGLVKAIRNQGTVAALKARGWGQLPWPSTPTLLALSTAFEGPR